MRAEHWSSSSASLPRRSAIRDAIKCNIVAAKRAEGSGKKRIYLTPGPSPTHPNAPTERGDHQFVLSMMTGIVRDPMKLEESKQQRFGRKIRYARTLRKKMTTSEAILWENLRSRRCSNLKFRRQVPMGFYVADFLCRERHLIIEVDGGIHQQTQTYDHERDEDQILHGYHVLRFRNDQIMKDIKTVLRLIKEVTKKHDTPSPGGQVGRVGEGVGG
ncbi:MAG: DUF559 domain-containing protein [Candidatus Peregrinibacteria bacterium]